MGMGFNKIDDKTKVNLPLGAFTWGLGGILTLTLEGLCIFVRTWVITEIFIEGL